MRIWVVFRFSQQQKLLNNLIIGDQYNSYSFMFSINSQKHGLRLQNDKRLWLWQFDRSKPILSVSLRFDIVVGIFLLLSLSPSSVCLVRFKSVNCSSRTRTITWWRPTDRTIDGGAVITSHNDLGYELTRTYGCMFVCICIMYIVAEMLSQIKRTNNQTKK